ncbi:tRNA pseudouridine(55) synthase TruB [Lacticaseibacillus nasuensis]|uniref:tRNA pseudouridine synthase B n=1 Tax=Lacticaseibacillus nasuensis JCM 17158 TaxID=1291734 RepID=A0A0R1JSW4_9LACO|nr:tRNA pseudouridine(55) synthase TruB [Lacticaseibacillus nasuensis]KRK74367.1 trna pseudouridine synthase b [Lacticaseibacillus nasuensis JCM 17158]
MELDGILPVYKPVGITSAGVVSQVRRLLHMRKVGHSGTLDPNVDGVLPIALGAATKAVPALMSLGKTYTGEVTLGFATETEDLDGAEVARQALAEPFSEAALLAGMQQLTGTITQVPPMYSAVKVNGRRLYEYARNGETVERPSRTATVYEFVPTAASQFDVESGTQRLQFSATVSKGTYIRTLAVDLGRVLGVPAVMSQLTRVASGGFTLADTLDLRDLTPTTAPAAVLAHLRPIEAAYPDLPLVALTDAQWAQVQNGVGLTLPTTVPQVGLCEQGTLKAIYARQGELYRPAVMFLANQGVTRNS